MKKFTVLCCALLIGFSAFAYHDSYSSGPDGFGIFMLLMMIAYIVLSITVLIRWWKMTKDVEQIRQHITYANPKLTYLVAIGEKEQAEKAALTMLVDQLYAIYTDNFDYSKAENMNKAIEARLPKIQKLGLSVPDYVTSGEKFIDYINGLTDNKVPYKVERNY